MEFFYNILNADFMISGLIWISNPFTYLCKAPTGETNSTRIFHWWHWLHQFSTFALIIIRDFKPIHKYLYFLNKTSKVRLMMKSVIFKWFYLLILATEPRWRLHHGKKKNVCVDYWGFLKKNSLSSSIFLTFLQSILWIW